MKLNVQVPARLEEMNPAAVKAAITRRAASEAKKLRYRRSMLSMILLVASAVTLVSVVSLANPKVEKTDAPMLCVYTQSQLGEWDISTAERTLVEKAVASAARGESDLAMQGVAQAIRQVAEENNWSVLKTLEENQYPVTWTGEIPPRVTAAVEKIADGYVAVGETIRYCYNPMTQTGVWHESLVPVCTISNIRFFR